MSSVQWFSGLLCCNKKTSRPGVADHTTVAQHCGAKASPLDAIDRPIVAAKLGRSESTVAAILAYSHGSDDVHRTAFLAERDAVLPSYLLVRAYAVRLDVAEDAELGLCRQRLGEDRNRQQDDLRGETRARQWNAVGAPLVFRNELTFLFNG